VIYCHINLVSSLPFTCGIANCWNINQYSNNSQSHKWKEGWTLRYLSDTISIFRKEAKTQIIRSTSATTQASNWGLIWHNWLSVVDFWHFKFPCLIDSISLLSQLSFRRETWWFPGILHFPLLLAACSSQIHTFDSHHQSCLLCVGNFAWFSEIYVPLAKILCIGVSRCVPYRYALLRDFFSSLTKDIELNQACVRPGLPIDFGV